MQSMPPAESGGKPIASAPGARRIFSMPPLAPVDFRRRLFGVALLPPLLLGALAAILFWQITRLINLSEWVDFTDRVIARAHFAQRLLIDMESGRRGFLLTGSEPFLRPYEEATRAFDGEWKALRGLVSHNPGPTRLLEEVSPAINSWREQTAGIIRLRRAGDPLARDEAAILRGKEMMDDIRDHLARFIVVEEGLRNERSLRARRHAWVTVAWSSGVTLLLGLALAAFDRSQMFGLARAYADVLAELWERARRQQEERFRLLVEAVDELALFSLDCGGRIQDWNAGAERLFGFASGEAIGRHLGMIYGERGRALGGAEEDLAAVMAGGRLEESTCLVGRAGAEVPARMLIVPVRGLSDELLGYSVVIKGVRRGEA
jgi:PAS domain S-box-containing protein